jgi:precorrin-6x reductase
MLKKYRSKFMVTKDSGAAGGFDDKVEAAAEAGAKLLVIGREPEEGSGYSEVLNYLYQQYADTQVSKN